MPASELDRPSRSLTSVRKQAKRAEKLAWNIERDILASGSPVGSHVGDEAQLIERYGVSRAILREAIQLVERHELAASRRGRTGGLIVTAQAEQSVAKTISMYLELVGISLKELVATRTVLELLALRNTVKSLDETGIETLRNVVRGEEDAGICASPHALHQAIIDLSGNSVIQVFLDALIPIVRRQPAVTSYAKSDATKDRPRLPDVHRKIAEAIVRSDVSSAEQSMTEHLQAVLKIRQPEQASVAITAGVPASPDRLAPPVPLVDFTYTGLGRASDLVLKSILQEVRTVGAAPGTFLGSETDLLNRHHASRSALREAIRLLEHVGVAEMRRGTSGGLFLTEPAPDGIGTTIAMYLEHGSASAKELGEVRLELELQSVRTIASHMTDDLSSRFESIVRRERRAGSKLIEPRDEDPYRLSMASHFHFALADFSENRATQLLSRPVIALTSGGHVRPLLDADEKERRAGQVRAAHRGIIEAMISGDQDIAAHRMRQHLTAVSTFAKTPPA